MARAPKIEKVNPENLRPGDVVVLFQNHGPFARVVPNTADHGPNVIRIQFEDGMISVESRGYPIRVIRKI